MSLFRQSAPQYLRLCATVLQNKRDSCNTLLAKKDMQNAQLISLSLNETAGFDKETIEYDDSQKIDAFISANEI